MSLVRDIKVRDNEGIKGEKEEMEESLDLPEFKSNFTTDGALQQNYPNELHTAKPGFRTISPGFNGIDNTNVSPADPSIAVGPNHVIQMVNGASGALFTIYNKSGVQLVAPTYLDNITGKGGLGDPVVLYDHLADRYVMTEFVNKNETQSQGLSIAVSQTSDPTGAWYIYFFSTGNSFPDYPKFSVWPDAWYAKTNDFNNNNNFTGATVYAFDRRAMLNGVASVSMQSFNVGMGYRDYSMVPVTLQGNTLPSAETGGLFAYLQEDAWTGSSVDSIGLVEFNVDFTTPANSEIVNRASIPAAAYSSKICGAARSQCIPQPNTTVMLEALDQRIMNQPVYRNFGNYEGIVFTNIVNNGTGISSLRWYELNNSNGNWNIQQQSTYLPDNVHRFMPCISYDSRGNIALVYNVSGTGTFPGISFTGRKKCDAPNMMTYAETSLATGTASNINSRYGDYNHLVCDPDGKTFWFTGMYNLTNRWSTRIVSFTLDTCISCNEPLTLTTTSINATNATLAWSAAPNAINYSVEYRIAGTTDWTLANPAATALTFTLTGLIASTTYDWRVRTNCTGNASRYSTAQFTTTNAAACAPPANLSSVNITNVSATLNWSGAAGAINYIVDYKSTSANNWQSATNGTTAVSLNLTGLSAGTVYDWRIKTNCPGSNSSYSTAQFKTTGTACNAPATLTVTAITPTGATLNWTAVAGGSKYAIDYKKNTTGSWTSASTGTTALSKAISSLTPGTLYDWRVKTICSTTNSSVYVTGQFTTVSVCPDQLESNNTLSAAKAITLNTPLLAQIASATDVDYYSFSNSSTQSNISVSLTNLPANYDLKLYSPTGTLLATSQNTGTASEIINYNTTVTGTYKVLVYGFNKSYNTINCYTLRAVTGSLAFAPEIYGRQVSVELGDMTIFPVPASRSVSISFNESERSFVSIHIENSLGKTVLSQRIPVLQGRNLQHFDISEYPAGMYMIKVLNSRGMRTQKFMISR